MINHEPTDMVRKNSFTFVEINFFDLTEYKDSLQSLAMHGWRITWPHAGRQCDPIEI